VPRPDRASATDTVVYRGEVWTDARGYATVHLPPEADALEPPVEYELHDLEPPTTARVTAELERGRFTIRTDEPHLKVGWRLTGRRPARPHDQEETR
jgi:hypothetical protein